MLRSIESVTLQVRASENAVDSGEFDPTMGENITSENHRALIVVHQGYGMEVLPQKYQSNQEYQEYLRRLEAEKQMYYDNGDPVVIVVTDLSLAKGLTSLEPHANTMYYVTQANNGFGALSFITDGKYFRQKMADGFLNPQGMGPWEILKTIGVIEVEMAGEFRGACPSQVSVGIEDAGLKIGWCDTCAFPMATTREELAQYPTLEPLP